MTTRDQITAEAQFLIDRLATFDSDVVQHFSSEQATEWCGHVVPAWHRLRALLASPSAEPARVMTRCGRAECVLQGILACGKPGCPATANSCAALVPVQQGVEGERLPSSVREQLNNTVSVPVDQLADIFRRLKILTLLGQSKIDETVPDDVLALRLKVFGQADFGAVFAGQWLPEAVRAQIRAELKNRVASGEFDTTASPPPPVHEDRLAKLGSQNAGMLALLRDFIACFKTGLNSNQGWNYPALHAIRERAEKVLRSAGVEQ